MPQRQELTASNIRSLLIWYTILFYEWKQKKPQTEETYYKVNEKKARKTAKNHTENKNTKKGKYEFKKITTYNLNFMNIFTHVRTHT